MATTLDREEYIEQAHFFRVLSQRLPENEPLQEILAGVQEEILATTKLPMAVQFFLTELMHHGVMAPAMARLSHYFTPFQTYVVQEAEDERGRFDMRIAVEVMRKEAEYRSESPTPQGIFLYQFETLCRNRLNYDRGMEAIARDPIFDTAWREWILTVRRQIGIVDLSDLVYVRSEHYLTRKRRTDAAYEPEKTLLFGDKEGRIALANRRKDPLYLFAALQRQLGYPSVPKPEPPDEVPRLIPQLLRRLEQMETRIKLLEEEQRSGAADLSQFIKRDTPP